MIVPIAALLISQAAVEAPVPEVTKLDLPFSSDFVDPAGMWRAHFVTRALFSDGERVFSGSTASAYEVRAHLRLAPGIALGAVIPFGVVTGHQGVTRSVFGNAALGFSLGGDPIQAGSTWLRFAGGLEAYAPTSVSSDATTHALGFMAALRSYEPQLFIPRTVAVRLRGQGEVTVSVVSIAAELGLVPAGTLVSGDSGFFMLLEAAGRLTVAASKAVEPFVEAGGSVALGGVGELKPPFMITPGIRFHIADVFAPALFASFNFVEGSAVMFGIDLAFAARPSLEQRRRADLGRDDDFLGDDFLDFD